MTDKKPTESDYDDEGFAVIWSESDGEYVGLAKHFPSMSWLAATPDEASAGIRRVVLETGIANIAANDRLLLDRLGDAYDEERRDRHI